MLYSLRSPPAASNQALDTGSSVATENKTFLHLQSITQSKRPCHTVYHGSKSHNIESTASLHCLAWVLTYTCIYCIYIVYMCIYIHILPGLALTLCWNNVCCDIISGSFSKFRRFLFVLSCSNFLPRSRPDGPSHRKTGMCLNCRGGLSLDCSIRICCWNFFILPCSSILQVVSGGK